MVGHHQHVSVQRAAQARHQRGHAHLDVGQGPAVRGRAHVERFVGVCGAADGLEAMPDGDFLPPFDFNCAELHLRVALRRRYRDRHVVQGRWAQLSEPREIHLQQGRGTCQARNLCMRGCPYGGYFSSVSSTPASRATLDALRVWQWRSAATGSHVGGLFF